MGTHPPTHTRAVVLAIGDEITLGERLDTNSQWLSAQLVDRGISIEKHISVPDDLVLITRAYQDAANAATLVISTGGLGPTEDDLTRRALNDAAGDELVTDEEALRTITAWFAKRGRELLEKNTVQALRPSRGRCLPNPNGTAPGLWTRIGDADAYALPGPPREMMPMFADHVLPSLRTDSSRKVLARTFVTAGISESAVATRLHTMMARDLNPNASTTASLGSVTIRLRYEGEDTPDAQAKLDALDREVREQVGGHLVGVGDEPVAAHVLASFRDAGAHLATAESCTGGLIGAMLTEIAGSSDVYAGGCVSYSNDAKVAHLGVSQDDLDRDGAVSRAVAVQMARGASTRFAIDPNRVTIGIGVTGVAGPGGGSDEKPVGTVWIAVAKAHNGVVSASDAREFRYPGERANVRQRTAVTTLLMAQSLVRGRETPEMLWERR